MADRPVAPVIRHLTADARFGTQTRLAEAAGVKPHTISGKAATRNPLTYEQMRRVLQSAPTMGVRLHPADFFPDLTDDDQPAQDAA